MVVFQFLLEAFLGVELFPGGLHQTARKTLFFVSPEILQFPGNGILVIILLFYIVGFVARIPLATRLIKSAMARVPVVGSFVVVLINAMEGLTRLVPVEVEYLPGVYKKGWLRQVRYETNLDTKEEFLACYVILATMPNPTSGWAFRVGAKKIVHRLDNPSIDVLRHVVSFGFYNPVWLYRTFRPEDFLDYDPIPKETLEKYKDMGT